MKIKGWIIAIMIILPVVFLSGCTDKPAVTTNNLGGVELESDIVELAYGNLTAYKENGVIKRVEVQYRLKNIANRYLNINTTVELYDDNNNLLFTGGHKEIGPIPPNYIEQIANTATYAGERAADVDHARLIVEEWYK